jgi:hypothetical protein
MVQQKYSPLFGQENCLKTGLTVPSILGFSQFEKNNDRGEYNLLVFSIGWIAGDADSCAIKAFHPVPCGLLV